MNGPAATVTPPAAEESESPSARPIAVVWCRQVDNEEESPGYTTIPEEFPGQRETVEIVRAVGHLAINVADTHDYWDPEPGNSLSYYPNLFLYPAYRGEYTCLGRMFLSKEDRPRLGMKTLVLPTAELLQPETFGPSILRWHASMGGLRKPLTVDRSAIEPGLYDRVGEGFLFHHGSTDPVLLIASERWDATMQVLLEMIGSLPAALTSLGGILAFPYFLPQARTDLRQLQEQIPLTLAVMRVAKTEAAGPRHDRRVQSWETASLTVRDLASDPLPSTGPRGKDPLPLVLQYLRDHAEAKLQPIRQRVDLVELPRQRAHLAEAERQSGRARRKESWRIGTAMESAALLLQRSRGRQIPVSGETAKRAQEYLRVAPLTTLAPPRELDSAEPMDGELWDSSEGPRRLAPRDRVESVPIPTREDPSLLPPSARSPMLGLAVPAEDGVALEESGLQRAVRAEVERQLADRGVATAPVEGAAPSPELHARVDALAESLSALPARVDASLTESLHQHQLAIAALREELRASAEAGEAKLRASFAAALAPEIDRRVRQAVEPKLAEALRVETERSHRATMDEVERAIAEMHERLQTAEEETRSTLTGQLDRHLRDAADREMTVREALEGRLKESLLGRLSEAEEHLAEASSLTEERLSGQLESRSQEVKAWVQELHEEAEARVPALLDERLRAVEERWNELGRSQTSEMKEAYVQAVADLQVRLEQHIEERIQEAETSERDKYLQLFARLKEELDQSTTKRLEAVGTLGVPKPVEAAIAQRQKEVLAALDHRLATIEERLHVEQSEGVQRLEKLEEMLAEKGDALVHVEESLRSDLRDLDYRTQLLTDRLIPVVRKAWLKIAEIQQTPGLATGPDPRIGEVRRELQAETHRLEGEIDRRITEMRHRVESAIAHQGRIWLTLVHHLKELADERTVTAVGINENPPPAWQETEAAAHATSPPPVASARPAKASAPAAVPSKPPARKLLRRASDPPRDP
jgi:hypothetical protein